MAKDSIDIKDLEAFIIGLKNSFDTLNNFDLIKAQGFQAQLAKAISNLRLKIVDKIETEPKFGEPASKDDVKKILLTELKNLKNLLESDENNEIAPRKKFELVKKIAEIRAILKMKE